MLSALVVVVIAMVVMKDDKSSLLGFTAMFVGFYLVMLVFDCVYFSQIEKKNKLK